MEKTHYSLLITHNFLLSASRFLQDGTRDYSYNYGYSYDPMGNPSQRTSQGQIRNYTANNLNQLASASGPNSTDVAGKVAPELVAPFNVSVNGQTATVDDKGNWIAQSVPLTQGENALTVQATDRFARTASEVRNVTLNPPPVFSYDPNGNMTSDGEWTYTYNDENRMIQQGKANDTKVEYIHDGLGRMRIEKSYSWTGSAWNLESEKHFVYDQNCIIAELDGSDSLIHSYVWGLDIDGGFGTAGGVGGLLLCDNELACYDGNGNRVAMIDLASGSVCYSCEYDPFGNVINETGTTACPFGFSTQYTSHGLVHYLYRDYSPKYSRWLSRDPIEEKGGYNLYCFVNNDAVNKIDILGLSSAPPSPNDPPSGLGLDSNWMVEQPDPPVCCEPKGIPKVTLKVVHKEILNGLSALGEGDDYRIASAVAGYQNMSGGVQEVHWAWYTCARGGARGGGFFPGGLDQNLRFIAGTIYSGGAYNVRTFFVITYCDPNLKQIRKVRVTINNGVNSDDSPSYWPYWKPLLRYRWYWGNSGPDFKTWTWSEGGN